MFCELLISISNYIYKGSYCIVSKEDRLSNFKIHFNIILEVNFREFSFKGKIFYSYCIKLSITRLTLFILYAVNIFYSYRFNISCIVGRQLTNF